MCVHVFLPDGGYYLFKFIRLITAAVLNPYKTLSDTLKN